MAKKNYEEMSDAIIANIGGKANISYFTHCVTRLRFNLKDKNLANIDILNQLPNVLGCHWAGEQLQIIVGQNVGEIYSLTCKRQGLQEEAAIDENIDGNLGKKRDFTPKAILNIFLDTITSILSPIIPAICGCGLLQGILFSGSILGLITDSSELYTFFLTIGNTAFYFIPILIAFSAGKRFQCNPYIAAALGAVLIHPTFLGIAGETYHLFGIIPITFADYTSTIIPVILCVYFMSWVEKGCKKVVPHMLDLIVTPLVELALGAIVGLALLAPLGNWIGTGIVSVFVALYNAIGPVGGAVFSGLYPFILATGMQVATVPIMVQEFATIGYDVLYPCIATTNAAMAAAALYVFFKSKNEKNKALGISTGVTALIGVTEPVLFGLVLKYRKALISVMTGGAIGGVIMGLFKVKYMSFGFVPFGTIILAITDTFIYYLIGVFVAMIVTVIMMYILKWED